MVSLSPVRTTGVVAFSALLLAGGAWAVRAVWELRLAGTGVPAGGVPEQGDGRHRPLTSLENGYHLVSSAGGVLTVVCALAFLLWLGRVRDNARTLSGRAPRYSGIWVLLGWVIPIGNLWIPRGIVADVFRDSAPERRLPWVVNVWWALWLVGLVSGTGLMSRDSTDDLIARAYDDVWPLVLSDLALVAAAVAGAFVVRAVSRVQEEPKGEGGVRVPAGSHV
ncbi:DUF4328 domain-containing protein [Streptomyces sp. NPDC051105]|uniref:DUF4328 domain-containing protein n=1 Tax=Streptomyces sp. NPDC051105 TaxID=3154843 RepID=UPI00342BE8A7